MILYYIYFSDDLSIPPSIVQLKITPYHHFTARAAQRWAVVTSIISAGFTLTPPKPH
jgi:hypothetical protein